MKTCLKCQLFRPSNEVAAAPANTRFLPQNPFQQLPLLKHLHPHNLFRLQLLA